MHLFLISELTYSAPPCSSVSEIGFVHKYKNIYFSGQGKGGVALSTIRWATLDLSTIATNKEVLSKWVPRFPCHSRFRPVSPKLVFEMWFLFKKHIVQSYLRCSDLGTWGWGLIELLLFKALQFKNFKRMYSWDERKWEGYWFREWVQLEPRFIYLLAVTEIYS